MSVPIAEVLKIANDLLLTYQAVQGIANGAIVAGRDSVTDVEMETVRKLARQAGSDLDAEIARAAIRHGAGPLHERPANTP